MARGFLESLLINTPYRSDHNNLGGTPDILL